MTPLEIFTYPGQVILAVLLKFLEIPAWKLSSELGDVFALLLSLIFWSFLLGQVVIPIIKHQFGFGSKGRY